MRYCILGFDKENIRQTRIFHNVITNGDSYPLTTMCTSNQKLIASASKCFLNSHAMPLILLCACLWVVEGSFGSIWSTNLQFVCRSFLLFLFGQGFVAVQIAVLHLPLRLYRHRCTVCPKKGSSSSSQFAVNDEGWEEGGGGRRGGY